MARARLGPTPSTPQRASASACLRAFRLPKCRSRAQRAVRRIRRSRRETSGESRKGSSRWRELGWRFRSVLCRRTSIANGFASWSISAIRIPGVRNPADTTASRPRAPAALGSGNPARRRDHSRLHAAGTGAARDERSEPCRGRAGSIRDGHRHVLECDRRRLEGWNGILFENPLPAFAVA